VPNVNVTLVGPLIATKLFAPRPRRGLVSRSRLNTLLDRGLDARLTLVSAPPGFGKTTLLADWMAAARPESRAIAWLSLDASDRDATRFWTHLIAAMRTVWPDGGVGAAALLQESQAPPIEAVVSTLLNEMSTLTHDLVLVLDDYHAIDAVAIHDAMAFLLERLPPRVHVVIVTRADPPLPLARLRARGELVEVRAADLRFTTEEAAGYLNDAMGLRLAGADVAVLEDRTEGWIAALQLAARSMQGRHDIASFISGFAGDDRYVVDYLVEEVLRLQPEERRTFLLRTSILERLSGPLCGAVTGEIGGSAMLEALERANLFLVALDERRQWYRYHHLFADVLRIRLRDELGSEVAELHRRASDWFARNDEPAEAIRHALASGDVERAADLIEEAIPDARRRRDLTLMTTWLRSLPDEVMCARPMLAVHDAGLFMLAGDLGAAERRLRDAKRVVPDGGAAAAPDGNGLRRPVTGLAATYSAAIEATRGNMAGAIAHAQLALAEAGPDDDADRAGATGFLALAHWRLGELDLAREFWTETAASLERAGFLSDALGATVALADVLLGLGRLRDAMATVERGRRLAASAEHTPIRGAADLDVTLAELLLERNDRDAARGHLEASLRLGEQGGLQQNAHRRSVAQARLRTAEGDPDAALALLDEADARYVPGFFPDVRPIAANRARLWIQQGRLREAAEWARDQGLAPDDDLTYSREYEHITLARLLLAQSSPAAPRLLNRLLEAAEGGGRLGTVIELLILRALELARRGGLAGALTSLDRALTLAQPEARIRLFVDEGTALAALLGQATRRGIAPSYLGEIRSGFEGSAPSVAARAGLIEPLSERELDVLRLLSSELDGPDIARQLFVSVNTVRTHTRNIYAKLGVTSRRAAVRRADELGLLARSPGSRLPRERFD
jgi:LuxR family maltose regulon positive regulatory protein